MTEEKKFYFIEKEGVYSQGVFWVGYDLEEGQRTVQELAEKDCDDYHSWVLYEYSPPTPVSERYKTILDSNNKEICSIKKKRNV